jgi:hypothetical protein
MSVGFNQDKTAIDARVGGLAATTRDLFTQIQLFQEFLAGKQVADLVALGYTSDEATELKTNFGVLDQFRQAFQGLQAIPTAVNVSGFLLPFVGVN